MLIQPLHYFIMLPQLRVYFQNLHHQPYQLTHLSNKYSNLVQQGKYTLSQPLQQANRQDQIYRKQIALVKAQLAKAQQQIQVLQSRQNQHSQQNNDAQQKIQRANQLIAKLKMQKLEIKKKKKFYEVQKNLKQDVQTELQLLKSLEEQKLVKQIKRQELAQRIREIQNRAQTRASSLHQFEIQYLDRMKHFMRSNKRLYEKMQQESRKKQQEQRGKLQQQYQSKQKGEVNWQKLKEHEKEYNKIIENYQLHKRNSRIEDDEIQSKISKQKSERLRPIKLVQIKPKATSSRAHRPNRVVTDENQIEPNVGKSLDPQKRKYLGNQYLSQSLIRLKKPISINNQYHKESQQSSKTYKNYLPEIKNGIRDSLKRLAQRLDHPMKVENETALLEKIRRLDQLTQKKQLLMKNSTTKKLQQQQQLVSLYIKNIKNKLSVLER